MDVQVTRMAEDWERWPEIKAWLADYCRYMGLSGESGQHFSPTLRQVVSELCAMAARSINFFKVDPKSIRCLGPLLCRHTLQELQEWLCEPLRWRRTWQKRREPLTLRHVQRQVLWGLAKPRALGHAGHEGSCSLGSLLMFLWSKRGPSRFRTGFVKLFQSGCVNL